MIRSIELELHTVSEANAREYWRARADRRAEQRRIIGDALRKEFGKPPSFELLVGALTRLGQVVVALTRIAPGELDADENLPMSFKAVKDEIADWLGVNDRDKRVRWTYHQERSAAGVYKVRIEIRDAAPGDDIRVQRATAAEHAAGELQRMHPLPKVRRPPPATQGVLPMMRSWMALPWEQKPCDACRGIRGHSGLRYECAVCRNTGRAITRTLAPVPQFVRLDDPPETLSVPVPAEHLERWPSAHVVLHRRRFKSRATGICWLYEERIDPS